MYTDYTILSATKKDELIALVKLGIENGWQPLGGVSVMSVAVNYEGKPKVEMVVSQAMVKWLGKIMDWTLVVALLNLALLVVVVGFWKPWAAGYAGEKSRNFARKEDLDIILAEVRAVTITQKEIESKLSGDLWHKQTMWNHKKEAYGELLATNASLRNNFIRLSTALSFNDIPTRNEATNEIINGQMRMANAIAMAGIFLSSELTTLLYTHSRKIMPTPINSAEEAQEHAVNAQALTGGIIQCAKKELGLLAPWQDFNNPLMLVYLRSGAKQESLFGGLRARTRNSK